MYKINVVNKNLSCLESTNYVRTITYLYTSTRLDWTKNCENVFKIRLEYD